MNIILLGAPGAGKGTQAAVIARKLGLTHLATGDLFRQALQKGTELGKKAKAYMERGALVPDEITISMVLEKIFSPEAGGGVALDGFPRNLEQAKALDRAMTERGKQLDRVVYIRVSESELLKRLGGRWICRQCQAPYHEVDSPPRAAGKCDACGGELYQRADDTPETVKKRLKVYFDETMPLIDYYTSTGKLVEVAGEGRVEEISRRILQALGAEPRAG
ncbi:MAG: adenylate kinase [Chloroflexi bacterium]|nr:adenylate kinase [Chloroflexota bacterium]